MLIGRENELNQIDNLLTAALKIDANPLSIYVGGTPGTGKTASVQYSVEKLKSTQHKFEFLAINCFEISSAAELYQRILCQLNNGVPPVRNNLLYQLRKFFTAAKNKIIILLDEVDRLSKSKTDALICTAFGWPEYSKGNVIVIGISNSLDLIDRILPKLRASRFPPKVITFAPYSKEQLVNILEVHMAEEGVDSTAIELCARKVSALTGDVRRAFHIANGVLNSMKENFDNSENISNSSECVAPSVPSKKKNACRYVLEELNNVYASPLLRAQLPLHPRILLATFVRLVSLHAKSGKRAGNQTMVARDKLLECYLKVCDALKFAALDSEELSNAFSVLESQGMIAYKAKGRVAFEVELEIARRVVNDNAILSAIDSVEL